MKLSTKGRYGLMAIYRLSLSYGSGPVPLSQIAESEGISQAYLEQLFGQLKKSGLVISERGAFGGYELSRQPSEITIGEIIRSLEGDISLSCCDFIGEVDCGKDSCRTKEVLDKIKDKINSVVNAISLEDMKNL